MFGKRRRKPDVSKLEGVITFFGSFHALRAEKVLLREGKEAALIPGPREVSPNCGVALRFDYDQHGDVRNILADFNIQYEGIHLYPA